MLPKLQPSTHRGHFLLAILLFYYFACSYQQVCNNQDLSSLLAFSSNISASPPLNWSSNISCCNWEGIGCDANGRVTRLHLPSRKLKGVITSSIGNLVTLTQLNLSNNLLSGYLSTGIFGFMDSLKLIDLSFNRLAGEFSLSLSSSSSSPLKIHTIDISNNQFHGAIEPSWFLRATNLVSFNCSNNSFNGSIPSSICANSPLLKTLDFSHNEFSGPIPRGLGGCLQLEAFWAGFNSLSGILSRGIFNSRALKEISLPSNHLHGAIGEEITSLTNLKIIELFSNSFSGSIPQKIGNLLHLEKLYLQNNYLSGSIPPSLMNCTNLVDIILRDNRLDGDISTLDFSSLLHLQKLDLRNNSFNGNLPESIYSCKSIVAIRVALNNLSGEISPKIAKLKSLSFLSLSYNSFTNIRRALRILANCKNLKTLLLSGSFHGEYLPGDKDLIASTGFPKLQILSLYGCNFTGGIPKWLSNLKSLEYLDMNYNKITGRFPPWMGALPNLFSLGLAYNNLHGEISKELCELPALVRQDVEASLGHFHFELPFLAARVLGGPIQDQFTTFRKGLDLQNNKLSGTIPLEIAKLKNLQFLVLGNNYFCGHIPVGMSKLVNLELLDLSGNNFTGEIPTSLESLNFLSDFNVSYNDLQGPIPTGGQFDTFSEDSYEGNPSLCGELLHRPCSKPAGSSKANDLHSLMTGRSAGKQAFLDGLLVGFASGFSGVIAIAAFYFWYNICTRWSPCSSYCYYLSLIELYRVLDCCI